MSAEHLPEIYTRFRETFPELVDAVDGLGAASDSAGPLDEKQRRLSKLAIAIGAQAPGSVRSNVRRALTAGASVEEIRHVVTLAVATLGLPAAVAAYGWVTEVLDRS